MLRKPLTQSASFLRLALKKSLGVWTTKMFFRALSATLQHRPNKLQSLPTTNCYSATNYISKAKLIICQNADNVLFFF